MFSALILNRINEGLNYVREIVRRPNEINHRYTILIGFANNQFTTRSLDEENWSASTEWTGKEEFQNWTESLTREDLSIIAEIFKEKNPYAIESSPICSSPSQENQVYQLYAVRADDVINCFQKKINKRKGQPAYIEPRREQFPLLAGEKNRKVYHA